MGVKFSNNGHSTLAASAASNATSITVASGHGARFPSLSSGEYFYATLIDASNNLEIVKVTARSSDVLTATRAQESTTARAYAIGDRIELRVTAAGIADATNIDNIVPSQSGNSGKFLKTDGTNVSFDTAGSTSASDLSSGTLAVGRLPVGTVVKVSRAYGTSQVSPSNSGNGRVYGDLLTITHTPVASGNRLILHGTAGFNSNGAESITGAFGIVFDISGAGSGDDANADMGNYPWYDGSIIYPGYPPDTHIHWNNATTGSGNITIKLKGYAYNEGSGTMQPRYRRYALTVTEVVE